MAKTLVVLRVSTDVQDTESQKKDLVSYLISKGLNEKDFIFLDAVGASAVKLNDAYQNFIEKIKAYCTSGKVDSIALWHLNRLGRNDRILSEMLFFFIDNKIQVYVKAPEFKLLDDDKNPILVSKMLWEMFSILIKSETDELKAKTKRGIDFKKSKGLYVGGKVKYGYKVVNDERVENIEESTIIKKIREEYATGNYSRKQLYEEFKGESLRGKDITAYTIETLLGDSFKEFSNKATNEKIDKVKATNNKQANKKQKGTYFALATKLIKCPDCGYNLGYNKGAYICINHSKMWRTGKKCSFTSSIKADILDNELLNLAIKIDSDKANVISREDIKKLSKEIVEWERKLQNIIKFKDKVITTKKRVLDNYEKGYIEEPERDSKVDKLNEQIKDLEERENSINSNITINKDKIVLIQDGNTKVDYSKLTDEDKYKLVHKHIEKIYVKSGESRYSKTLIVYDKYDRVYNYQYNSRDSKTPIKLVKFRIDTKRLELEQLGKASDILNNKTAKDLIDLDYKRVIKIHKLDDE